MRRLWVSIPLMTAVLILVNSSRYSYAMDNKTKQWRYPNEVHRLVQEKLSGPKKSQRQGTWSEWSPWTPCSRSCGTGVSSQTRRCVPKRESTTSGNFPNETERCSGTDERYHVCSTQDCPDSSVDFRQVQCQSFNSISFNGIRYMWEAHLDERNPCDLNCRPSGFRFFAAPLNRSVSDGTPCGVSADSNQKKICVSGSCKVIGCDGIVGSDKRPDACGVCGGDNSTCQIVSGIFTEPHLPHGYNLIAQLPKGACHINITVLKPTRNHLALRVAADGSFIINGNWDINWSGDYHAAGTTFKYTRQEALIPEYISSQGPLTEPVDMMVIANQVNPGIKYEYVIPIVNWRANGRSAANPSSAGINPGIPGGSPYPSLSSSGGLAHFGIVPQFADPSNPAPAATGPKVPSHRRNQRPHHGRHRSQDRAGNPRLPSDVQGTDPNTEGTNGVSHRRHKRAKFVWKQTGFTECSKTCGTGTQVTLSVCIKEDTGAPVPERRCKEDEKPPAETVRCNTNPCPAEWVASEWSPCSVTCGEGVQTRDLSCKQEISPTLTMKVPEAACLSPPPTVQNRRTCNPGPCTTWRTSAWSKCSADCGKGLRYRKVHCTTEDGQEVNESLCRVGDRPADNEVCDSGSCSANTWFFSDWSEHCSEDCGNGLQSRKVVCTGTAESQCDAAARPESTRTCVSTKDCSGKWFAGPWSQCSSSCNEGLQTREVLCLTFVRGQYRVGLDTQCPESERPEKQQSCNSGPCASQWFMSDWSECSVTCGTGAQRREVKCLDEMQRPSEDCLEEKRPPQRQACHSTPCAVETSQALADEETTNLEAKETESRDLPPVNAESRRQVSKGSPKKSSRHRNQARLAVNQDTSGDTCVDKFKNCHLVVQARLCRLRYYLVSCCSSCTKQRP